MHAGDYVTTEDVNKIITSRVLVYERSTAPHEAFRVWQQKWCRIRNRRVCWNWKYRNTPNLFIIFVNLYHFITSQLNYIFHFLYKKNSCIFLLLYSLFCFPEIPSTFNSCWFLLEDIAADRLWSARDLSRWVSRSRIALSGCVPWSGALSGWTGVTAPKLLFDCIWMTTDYNRAYRMVHKIVANRP